MSHSGGFYDLKQHVKARPSRKSFSSTLTSLLVGSTSSTASGHQRVGERNTETKHHQEHLHSSPSHPFYPQTELLKDAEKDSEWLTKEGQEKLHSLGGKLWDFCSERPGKKNNSNFKDLMWGLKVLYEVRNHEEGGMTTARAVNLMRALDQNGDQTLSKQEFLDFLFDDEDLDPETVKLNSITQELMKMKSLMYGIETNRLTGSVTTGSDVVRRARRTLSKVLSTVKSTDIPRCLISVLSVRSVLALFSLFALFSLQRPPSTTTDLHFSYKNSKKTYIMQPVQENETQLARTKHRMSASSYTDLNRIYDSLKEAGRSEFHCPIVILELGTTRFRGALFGTDGECIGKTFCLFFARNTVLFVLREEVHKTSTKTSTGRVQDEYKTSTRRVLGGTRDLTRFHLCILFCFDRCPRSLVPSNLGTIKKRPRNVNIDPNSFFGICTKHRNTVFEYRMFGAVVRCLCIHGHWCIDGK